MRRGEALALRWVDFRRRPDAVAIHRSLTLAGDKLHVTTPKSEVECQGHVRGSRCHHRARRSSYQPSLAYFPQSQPYWPLRLSRLRLPPTVVVHVVGQAERPVIVP